MCACARVPAFIASVHLRAAAKFHIRLTQTSFTQDVCAAADNSSRLPSQRDIRPCFCRAEEVLGVCILYQTACYLGVVGTQRGLQVNKKQTLACARFRFAFLSPSLLSFFFTVFSLSLLISCSPLLFHSFSFFLPSDSLSLFLPLPVSLWPGSSCAWEKLTVVSPENLSESGEKGEAESI